MGRLNRTASIAPSGIIWLELHCRSTRIFTPRSDGFKVDGKHYPLVDQAEAVKTREARPFKFGCQRHKSSYHQRSMKNERSTSIRRHQCPPSSRGHVIPALMR